MKTLFIAELLGNPELWKNVIAQEAQKADRIVQLGNLLSHYTVRKDKKLGGPNQQLMRLMNAYRYTQENWLQLAGPNELLALNMPTAFTNEQTHHMLRESWFGTSEGEPFMKVAGVDRGRLVSHGGLTYGLWKGIGSPKTAVEAANSLQELYGGTLYQGESYKLGKAPNYAANPIWADPLWETYPSWLTAEEPCPFGQLHAASTVNSPDGRLLRGSEGTVLKWLEKVRLKSYGSLVEIKGVEFIGLQLRLPLERVKWLPAESSLYLEETV